MLTESFLLACCLFFACLAFSSRCVLQDPYFMKNHLGSYECKLCLTIHIGEGSYLAHTQGKRHQENISRRGVCFSLRSFSFLSAIQHIFREPCFVFYSCCICLFFVFPLRQPLVKSNRRKCKRPPLQHMRTLYFVSLFFVLCCSCSCQLAVFPAIFSRSQTAPRSRLRSSTLSRSAHLATRW